MPRKVLSTVTFLLFLSITAFGQAQATKSRSLEELKRATSKFQNGKNFRVAYDKSKDMAGVAYDSFDVVKADYAVEGIYLQMGMFFLIKGTALTETATEFYFHFICKSKDGALQKNREFMAIADDARFNFGTGDHNGGGETNPFANVVIEERIVYKISRADLEKLANANSVEMRVGKHSFQINDENKQMFKDMLSLSKVE